MFFFDPDMHFYDAYSGKFISFSFFYPSESIFSCLSAVLSELRLYVKPSSSLIHLGLFITPEPPVQQDPSMLSVNTVSVVLIWLVD